MRILDNIGLVQDPIHLGAVILDKLIGDLKSKLPFLTKKKGNDDDLDEELDDGDGTETETEVSSEDDEKTNVARPRAKVKAEDDTSVDEEVPADNSLVAKLKAKISALQKKKKPEDDLEAQIADENDAPVKEKKKPNLIVIIGAIGLIAFIFLSDFGEEETPAPTAEVKLKKRPRPQKPKETTPTETTPPTDTAVTTPTETTPPTDTAVTTPTETTPPMETTPPTDTAVTTPTETTPPTDTAVTTPTETTPTETTPTDSTVTTEPSTTESPVDTTVTTAPEETTSTTPTEATTTPEETTTATTTTSPTDNATTDSVTGEDTKPGDDNLTDQILKDLENQAQGTAEKPKSAPITQYVVPPNYENVGRGLVYNCTGKHWACIDGPSYKTCEDNAASVKYLSKKAECYPFNVYETQSGCEKMQNRMVSSSAKTEFCSTEN